MNHNIENDLDSGSIKRGYLDARSFEDSAAASLIPAPLYQTLEWLIGREEFVAAHALIRAIAKVLPPDNPVASDFLAQFFSRSKSYKDAVRQAMHTLSLIPDSLEATFNAAKCHGSAGNPYAAEELMGKVVLQKSDWVDPKIDLAVYVGAQGRFDEAKIMLESILERLPPDNPHVDVVKFNLGWHFIRTGQFKKGMKWLGLGRRLRIWGAYAMKFPRPILTPTTDVAGKTVLLCGEGGAGDEMINVRFAKVIQERGGRVQWLPQHQLASLMSRATGVERVVTRQISLLGAYDYWAPAMDLPAILDLDLHQIPNEPYLSASDEYLEKWQRIFQRFDQTKDPRKKRLKVGLRWQGNALYEQDLMRTIPFRLLEKFTEIDGIDFYSLQRDEGSEERPQHSPVADLGPLLETWDDTAAAISHLDLVISSCTSVPHLAAAMGKPTWIISPLSPYYIWAVPGELSPWYPSVRLFRQTVFNDWTGPIAAVRERLKSTVKQFEKLNSVNQTSTVIKINPREHLGYS